MNDERAIEMAYAEGVRYVLCPRCHGGSTNEVSMSVYMADDGRVMGKCHRASCGHLIFAGSLGRSPPPPFSPTPLLEPYRLLEEGDLLTKAWRRNTGYEDIARVLARARDRYFRVLKNDPTTCVWRLTALDYVHLGHITRTLGKSIRTYKEVDRPLYYYNGHCDVFGSGVCIFEDPMSAAVCYLPAIALLGTCLSEDVAREIKNAPQRLHTAYVMLDPGAEDAALKVYERLHNAGVRAIFVPMDKDFKDMTPEERKDLLEAYA